jgi:hypothetical protein
VRRDELVALLYVMLALTALAAGVKWVLEAMA